MYECVDNINSLMTKGHCRRMLCNPAAGVWAKHGPLSGPMQLPRWIMVAFTWQRPDLHDTVQVPTACSGVPTEILNPATQWKNKGEFDSTLSHLADLYLVSHLRQRCACCAHEVPFGASQAVHSITTTSDSRQKWSCRGSAV